MKHAQEIEGILKQVNVWPPEERLALAHRLLERNLLSPVPRQTLRDALGIARGAEEPPSDDDVKRWIEEERVAKYLK